MRKQWLCGLVLLVVSHAIPGYAQEKGEIQSGTVGTLGVRAGFGLDPDQFVLGAQVALGKTLGIGRVVPSVDVGLGSQLTTISFNGDLQFRLNVEGSEFGLYGGAGPALVYADADAGESSWYLGLTLLAGAHLPIMGLPLNAEARFGVGDVPDFRGLLILEF